MINSKAHRPEPGTAPATKPVTIVPVTRVANMEELDTWPEGTAFVSATSSLYVKHFGYRTPGYTEPVPRESIMFPAIILHLDRAS